MKLSNRKIWGRCASLLLLALFVTLSPQQARPQADFSSLYQLIAPPVVRVDALPIGTGTGFVAQYLPAPDAEPQTGIVTACHVVIESPLKLGDPNSKRIVNVTFSAWKPDLTIKAAVTKCDAAHDAALLQPLNDKGEVTTLGKLFDELALKKNDPSLRSFPRLYFGDSDDVKPLDSIFVLGYPSPFAELTSMLGRVSGFLPVPYVIAESGRVDRVLAIMIYTGEPDEEVDLDKVLQIQTLPGLNLQQLADLAQNILDAGYNFLLISAIQPTDSTLTGWDVVAIEDGILKMQERPISLRFGFFSISLDIGPRIESFGKASLLREFIRVDVPVGAGHSGGPVMNIHGQVIGMIEWGVADTPGANFANPVNSFRKALFGN